MITLKLAQQTVQLDQGELVSYVVEGYEYMHQKGSPGWRSTDTEMFPIIGPTTTTNFRVWTPKGDAIQDQHGLLRELQYELLRQSDSDAVFQKKYRANTKIANSKYPAKSLEKELYWPYDFQFQKIITLTEEGLEITFKIVAEEGMPFMLGYHPAFKTEGGATELKLSATKSVSVSEIQAVGSGAYHVPHTKAVILGNTHSIAIDTEGFGQFMLWTEVETMLCVEPITFYPAGTAKETLLDGYQFMGKAPKLFSVLLKPS